MLCCIHKRKQCALGPGVFCDDFPHRARSDETTVRDLLNLCRLGRGPSHFFCEAHCMYCTVEPRAGARPTGCSPVGHLASPSHQQGTLVNLTSAAEISLLPPTAAPRHRDHVGGEAQIYLACFLRHASVHLTKTKPIRTGHRQASTESPQVGRGRHDDLGENTLESRRGTVSSIANCDPCPVLTPKAP